MPEANGAEPITEDVLNRLNDLIRRGQDDETALPEIRQFFDLHPEVWKKISDLSYVADLAIANLAARNNTVLTEAFMRRIAELKSELVEPDAPPLEKLLADSVATCWLAAAEAEITAKDNLDKTPARSDFLDRRRDRAHKRLQAAIKVLALVRKLLRPAKSPLEIATTLGGSKGCHKAELRKPGSIKRGTPVLN
jgi:hypothetical protein